LVRTVLATLVLGFATLTAIAQSLTWDPAGNGSMSGGSGVWNTGSWSNGTTDVKWTDGNDAALQGTGGTVSLTAPVLVNNLMISPSSKDYTIAGSSVLTLNSSASNILDPGVNFYFGPTILNNGNNTTISAPMTTNNGTELNVAGTGTLSLTGSSTFNNTRFYLYSGNLLISGTGTVNQNGSWNDIGSGSNSDLSLTLKDSGRFLTNGDFNLGDTPSQITGNTVTVNVQDNALLQSGNIYIGKGNNTGIVNVSGGTVSPWDIRVGANGVGIYNQTGGTANLGGWFRIAENTGSSGTANITNATVNIGPTTGMQLNIGEGGSGLMNVVNSHVTVGGLVAIGGATYDGETSGSGTLNQMNGSISTASGEFWVGQGAGGNGVYNISSGMLTTQNWIAVGRQGATGVLNQTGGTISKQGTNNIIIGSLGGNGAWDLNNGTVLNNGILGLGENSNSGTLYLNSGGLFQATSVQTWGGATGYLYFNGGTLQISGNGGYIGARDPVAGGVLNTYIQAGGAIIDTNGNNIEVQNPMAPDPSLPAGVSDGGLIKDGLGTLALNGTVSTASNAGPSSYAGPTVVNAGTLLFTGSFSGTGGIHVKSGATIGGDVAIPAVTVDKGGTVAPGYTLANPLQTGNFLLGSLTTSSSAILAFKLSNSAANGNDQITVAGKMSLAADTIIDVSTLLNGALASGTYDLISAPANTTAVGGLILTGLPVSRQKYNLDYSSPTAVNLHVSAATPANLVWTGSVNNIWDVTTTKNWYNTGTQAADLFFNLDNVTFNDTNKANNVVSIPANVQPGSVTLNLSSSTTFTLTGTGGITGPTGLVMNGSNGSGTLNVSTPNSYTGETDIHAGAVVINAGGVLGDYKYVNATNIAPVAGDTATLTVSGGTLLGNTITVGAGGSGTLNVTGGQLITGNNYPAFTVGGSGGTGFMSLSGSGSVDNSNTGNDPVFVIGNNSSGTLTQSGKSSINTRKGEFWIGENVAGAGLYDMSGGSLQVGNWFVVGRQGATGAAYISGNSSVTVTNGPISVGDGGPGTLVQSGSSVINVATDNVYLGTNPGANGVYALQSGTINTGDIRVGVGGTGEFDVSSGLANLRWWFRIGQNAGSSGTANISGGTINVGMNPNGTTNGGMWVHVGELGQGELNISNGLLTSTYTFDIGDVGSGTVSQTGGTMNVGNEFWVSNNNGTGVYSISAGQLITQSWIAVGRLGGVGLLNMSGGTISKQGGGNIIVGSLGGNGTWNMNGGLVLNNSFLLLGEGTNTGTFYLNGGTVQATGVGNNNSNGGNASTGYLYFNGGVLQASAANSDFFANSSDGTAPSGMNINYYIQSGGAIIDTNGFNIAINNVLATDPALTTTDGGLTKIGVGILTLAGTDSYAGGTKVSGGVLTYLNADAQPGSGTTTVAAGATLGLGVGNAAGLYSSADLDALFAGTMPNVKNDPHSNVGIDTSAGDFTYASNIPSTTRGLAKLGANTLTLTGANRYAGGTTVFDGTLQIGNSAALGSGGLTVGSNGTVDLNGISLSALPSLNGAPGAVITDNSVPAVQPVPTLLAVDIASGGSTYAGSITKGSNEQDIAFAKGGAGTLVLSGSDSYRGGTTVDAGTLVATTAAAIPPGTSLTVAPRAVFVFDPSQAASPVIGSPLGVSSAGVSAVPEPGTLTLLMAAVAIAFGVWRKGRG